MTNIRYMWGFDLRHAVWLTSIQQISDTSHKYCRSAYTYLHILCSFLHIKTLSFKCYAIYFGLELLRLCALYWCVRNFCHHTLSSVWLFYSHIMQKISVRVLLLSHFKLSLFTQHSEDFHMHVENQPIDVEASVNKTRLVSAEPIVWV